MLDYLGFILGGIVEADVLAVLGDPREMQGGVLSKEIFLYLLHLLLSYH